MTWAWNEFDIELRDELAALFPDKQEIRNLLDDAGIPWLYIALTDRPITSWHAAITETERQRKVDPLIAAALARYPDNPILERLRRRETRPTAPALTWRGTKAVSLEKITGIRSTLLDVCFLERGLLASRAVARVRLPDDAGTGFLIAGDRLVTNHHVLRTLEDATRARIDFNYQRTLDGRDADVDTFELDPAGFETNADDDWTVVRVKPKEGRRAAETWGALELADAPLKVDAPVNIIQHPGGGPKQVALYHNLVVFVDDRIVQYLTDTAAGSSGSPVFNDDWKVVAVHRASVATPDLAKGLFLRNEGVRSRVLLSAVPGLARA